MGYEVEMHIGVVRLNDWLDVVGMVDLCGVGDSVYSLSKDTSGKPVFFYGSDGNTKIKSDRYDKRLTTVAPSLALEVLKGAHRGDRYRRYAVAIAMLEAAIEGFRDEELAVVFFCD